MEHNERSPSPSPSDSEGEPESRDGYASGSTPPLVQRTIPDQAMETEILRSMLHGTQQMIISVRLCTLLGERELQAVMALEHRFRWKLNENSNRV